MADGYFIPKPFVRRLGMDAAFLLSELIVASEQVRRGDWFQWDCHEFFAITAWTKEQFDDAYMTLRLNKLVEYDNGTFVKYRIERPEGHWFRLNFARIESMEQ